MASAGERILQAIEAALNGNLSAQSDTPLPIIRQNPRPMNIENTDGTSGIDGILLYALKEENERVTRNRVDRQRSIRFEIPVAGPPPLDAAADPIYLWIVQTLFSEPVMTALAQEAGVQKTFWLEEVGTIWETVSSYTDFSVCALEMKLKFATTTDPSVRV